MRKIELEQGSDAWLAWRKGLLTATDAPVLMGVSPYATPYKGWQRKLSLIEEQKSNSAMERGRRDEPIARDMFMEEYEINMNPCVIESDRYNFLGASLDGISDCGRFMLEIKSNGDQYHFNLDTKGIPDFHLFQIQHALLSSDGTAEMCFYTSYNQGNIIVKEVYPDHDWMRNYLVEAREFWRRIVFFDPPPLTNKDYKDMNECKEWRSNAAEYKKVCDQIKVLEKIKEDYREEIIKLCNEESSAGGGIKVLKKICKGRVDYEAIPELACVDLEKYRKSTNTSWMITTDQK